ncbi:hypothetical protein Pr1d_52060 [Bythopirellula goksoeyrii]|uniref:Uncharacterized protein n=1 Tax=Bythopirellula goksoeyrii TaxID=1400387 RepID=A0A5B9QFQ9_9BACT|nr:hypothetical protein Pr1d_52060 [Bythopirellula goksoeyrii]
MGYHQKEMTNDQLEQQLPPSLEIGYWSLAISPPSSPPFRRV